LTRTRRRGRLFLAGVDGPGGLRLDRLAAADVSVFLARECPKRSVSGARDLVSALRSFLRYLHLVGRIDAPLVWALPSVADLRDRTLPRGLEPAAVKRLLASCDRRRLVGRRDFAILLLLSRLGLRAGEVARLRLDDVDWHRCCWFTARAAATTSCRCPTMSGGRWCPIFADGRAASRGRCLCG
jgi:integrase